MLNIINKLDIFPTANLILQVNEKSNIRGCATRTTARPSFKEASIAEIYDYHYLKKYVSV